MTREGGELLQTTCRLWFNELVTKEFVGELVKRVYEECSLDAGIDDANKWSEDENGKRFEFPEEVYYRDLRSLETAGGSLKKLVATKQREIAGDRLCLKRVQEWVNEVDPERERLMQIAEGVEIQLSSDFVMTETPGALRKSYLQVSSAVNKMIYQDWLEGHKVILPIDAVLRCGKKTGERVNFVPQSFALNGKKKQGRSITDPSKGRNMRDCEAVNSEEGKAIMKAKYGALKLPTIKGLVEMVLRAVDKYGWDRTQLWAGDIRAAFAQLFVKPEDAAILTTLLTNELCAIGTVMTYGFMGTPYVFGPVTRVSVTEINEVIEGEADMFVDDLLGVCDIDDLESDRIKAYKVITNLLGSQAIIEKDKEGDKYRKGRALDWIGWHINLDRRTIEIADKNYVKTVYAFFSLDLDKPIARKQMEMIAACGSRYTLCVRQMRPFVHHLHKQLGVCRRTNRGHTMISNEARLDIYMWRAFLVLMALKPGKYYRKLDSFRMKVWLALLRYDSSLKGLGLVLELLSSEGGVRVVKVASIVTRYELKGEARYQNAMEFASIVLCFLIMAEMGWKDIPLKIVGDSVASLTWADKERFRSVVARGAAAAFMSLGVEFNYWIEDTEFIKGEDNTTCDKLSRRAETGESAEELVVKLGFGRELLWSENESMAGKELLSICNPKDVIETEEQFLKLGAKIRRMVNMVQNSKIRV